MRVASPTAGSVPILSLQSFPFFTRYRDKLSLSLVRRPRQRPVCPLNRSCHSPFAWSQSLKEHPFLHDPSCLIIHSSSVPSLKLHSTKLQIASGGPERQIGRLFSYQRGCTGANALEGKPSNVTNRISPSNWLVGAGGQNKPSIVDPHYPN